MKIHYTFKARKSGGGSYEYSNIYTLNTPGWTIPKIKRAVQEWYERHCEVNHLHTIEGGATFELRK